MGWRICPRTPALPFGLACHSDCSSQYGSAAYRKVLAQAGLDQSMSARANLYHNAWSESFYRLPKDRNASGRLLRKLN